MNTPVDDAYGNDTSGDIGENARSGSASLQDATQDGETALRLRGSFASSAADPRNSADFTPGVARTITENAKDEVQMEIHHAEPNT